MITFSKHGEGWCLKGPAAELREGATVTVTKKDGSKQQCNVGRFIERCDKGDVKFEAVRSDNRSGQGQSRPQTQAAPASNAALDALAQSLALAHRKLDSILDALYPGTNKPVQPEAPPTEQPPASGADIPF